MKITETEEVKEDEEKGRCLLSFSQRVSVLFFEGGPLPECFDVWVDSPLALAC